MAADIAIFATSVAVVVGATGGIGQALVAALQADDRFSEVIAFSRSGALPIDLLNEQSIAEAAKLAAARGAIRLVIDATGFLHDADYAPEKAISQSRSGAFAQIIRDQCDWTGAADEAIPAAACAIGTFCVRDFVGAGRQHRR